MWWLTNLYFNKKIKKNFTFLITPALLLLIIITTIYNIVFEIKVISMRPSYLYANQSEIESYIWIKNNLKDTENIIAGRFHAMVIPYYTTRHVLFGHHYLSPYFQEGLMFIENRFFATNEQDQSKYFWLIKNHVNYIYYASFEKNLGNFQPDNKDYLKKVYDNQEIQIYKVL